MKLSKFSHLLLGVVIGVGLTASAGAYAATSTKVGKKIAGEIAVYLNGDQAPSKAIVVDGTSYLPVRWTAEAAGMGLQVSKGRVDLKSPVSSVSPTPGDGQETGTEGDTVDYSTFNTAELEERLEIAISEIRSLNNSIETLEILRRSASDNPDGVQHIDEAIARDERDIEKYTLRKAAIEAELATRQ